MLFNNPDIFSGNRLSTRSANWVQVEHAMPVALPIGSDRRESLADYQYRTETGVIVTSTAESYQQSLRDALEASLDADITNNASAISTLDTRVTTAEGNITANSSSITSLTATVGTNTASISTNASAIATLDGYASTQYSLTTDVNGHITGFELINGGAGNSSFEIQVDSFKIVNATNALVPFTISSGKIYMNATDVLINGSLIVTGTINGVKLSNATVTGGKIANNTITAANIAANTITASEIAAGTITATQIASSYVYAGTLTASQIYAGTDGTDGTYSYYVAVTGTSKRSFYGKTAMKIVLQAGDGGDAGYFESKSSGAGVKGYCSSSGYGLEGQNTSSGTAVRAAASSGSGLHASSSSGYGAYGYSSSNYGVYGYSVGNDGGNFSGGDDGVYAVSRTSGYTSVVGWGASAGTKGGYFRAHTQDGCQGYGASGYYDFRAVGAGTAGPFTGGHDGLIDKNLNYEIGDIFIDMSIYEKKSVSDTISINTLSTIASDSRCIGVVSSDKYYDFEELSGLSEELIETTTKKIKDPNNKDITIHKHKSKKTVKPEHTQKLKAYARVILNAVGEGQVNVCELNGNIEAGDYITTSALPGKGQKQDDDLLHNYTVAKAREDVDWSDSTDKDIYIKNGIKCKMIACTYHCG